MTEILEMLPLSPVREWAISRSFMASSSDEAHLRRGAIAREQNGGDRSPVARGFERATAPGRTIGVERLDFVADPYRFAQIFSAAGNADAHLIRLVGPRRDLRTVQ